MTDYVTWTLIELLPLNCHELWGKFLDHFINISNTYVQISTSDEIWDKFGGNFVEILHMLLASSHPLAVKLGTCKILSDEAKTGYSK